MHGNTEYIMTVFATDDQSILKTGTVLLLKKKILSTSWLLCIHFLKLCCYIFFCAHFCALVLEYKLKRKMDTNQHLAQVSLSRVHAIILTVNVCIHVHVIRNEQFKKARH